MNVHGGNGDVAQRTVSITAETIRDGEGEVIAAVAVFRDISEKKRDEAELARRAAELQTLSFADELTGLHNRRGFLQLAKQQLKLTARTGRSAALFFADMNGMKAINDNLGHEAGDAALIDAAALLRDVFRESDILARLGGDEFVVFAPEFSAIGIEGFRARLQSRLSSFNASSGRPYTLSISVGAAIYDPERPCDLEALLQRANI